ncbi:MAG: phage shock protein operon transcriptional activator [Spirochaetales bacterium]|nr:phage shock protein operon transcriptional activator [Spirochaetales bacterium]
MATDYTSRNDALGESPEFMDFQQNLSLAARVDRPVLLVGERGTGKELAAARLHFLSSRWKEPYVPVNCAALPPSLLESELFGHESGSFTGAGKMRKGRFEEADGGTLFLDEIGLVPMEVQEKILRTVEYGRFSRVGSSQEQEVNVRIIGATNADLPALCREGKFKEDLLDRLSFEVLYLPPLRYRGSDITLLASHFAMRMSRELGKPDVPEFTPELIQKIQGYPWPGNVRELKNTIERAVYKTEGKLIEEIELEPFSNPYPSLEQFSRKGAAHTRAFRDEEPAPEENGEEAGKVGAAQNNEELTSGPSEPAGEIPLAGYREHMLQVELNFIRRALEENRFSQKKAAEALGLSYDQFRGLYKKYQSLLAEE